jgi:hypothetical protein
MRQEASKVWSGSVPPRMIVVVIVHVFNILNVFNILDIFNILNPFSILISWLWVSFGVYIRQCDNSFDLGSETY